MRFLIFMISGLFLSGIAFGGKPFDFTKGAQITEKEGILWVEDQIIQDNIDNIDETIKLNPVSFNKIDMGSVLYQAGFEFYQSQKRMLGLKAFLKGFESADSPYRWQCGYYAAKIYYQMNRRDLALTYINRSISNIQDAGLYKDAIDLKRRISWEYISQYEGLPDDSISDIEFNGDEVWAATWTGGVASYNKNTKIMTLYKAGKNGLISNFSRDIKFYLNKVWVATTEGICTFNPAAGIWEREEGKIGKAAVKKLKLAGGNFYAATLGKGLFQYDSNKNTWKSFFTSASNITDVASSGNNLYISALDSGLFLIKNQKIIQTISNLSVKVLCVSGNILWAGTYGHGLYQINAIKGSIEKIYTVAGGGPSSDYIEAIESAPQSDHDRLIIGTLGGGALFFYPKENRWENLTVQDGLPSNDIMRIALEDHKIWFGALSGGIGIYLSE